MAGLSMCWCCGLISDNLPPPPSPEVQQGVEVPNGILEGLHAFSCPFFSLTSLFSLAHHCFGLLFRFEVVCFISSSTKLICVWFNRYWKITYSLRWMNRCLLFWWLQGSYFQYFNIQSIFFCTKLKDIQFNKTEFFFFIKLRFIPLMFVILQFILVSENPDMLTIEVTKGLNI